MFMTEINWIVNAFSSFNIIKQLRLVTKTN